MYSLFQAVAQGRDTVDYVLHPVGNDTSMAVVKIASNSGIVSTKVLVKVESTF